MPRWTIQCCVGGNSGKVAASLFTSASATGVSTLVSWGITLPEADAQGKEFWGATVATAKTRSVPGYSRSPTPPSKCVNWYCWSGTYTDPRGPGRLSKRVNERASQAGSGCGVQKRGKPRPRPHPAQGQMRVVGPLVAHHPRLAAGPGHLAGERRERLAASRHTDPEHPRAGRGPEAAERPLSGA